MGQEICTHDQSSGFIHNNAQLKTTTLYFTQDPLKNTRKYNPDINKNSNFPKTISLQYQKSQEQYKQDSYHDNNMQVSKTSRIKDNAILQQMKRHSVEAQAYAQSQLVVFKNLKRFAVEDNGQQVVRNNKRTIVPNPKLQKIVAVKKSQLGQFQNHVGNPDVPIGTFDNKFYSLSNKIVYRGEWLKSQQLDQAASLQIRENDRVHGKGQYYLPDNTYVQAFAEHNKINGYGRLININGDCYEGQFQDNKANGIGRYWQGDIFYNGGFKDNLPHGNGQQCTDLYTFIGQFENGYRKKGKLTWKNKKEDTDHFIYEGQFINNMIKPNGKLRINGQLTSYDNFYVK